MGVRYIFFFCIFCALFLTNEQISLVTKHTPTTVFVRFYVPVVWWVFFFFSSIFILYFLIILFMFHPNHLFMSVGIL